MPSQKRGQDEIPPFRPGGAGETRSTRAAARIDPRQELRHSRGAGTDRSMSDRPAALRSGRRSGPPHPLTRTTYKSWIANGEPSLMPFLHPAAASYSGARADRSGWNKTFERGPVPVVGSTP
jgi:hypothetical protein